MEEAIASSMIEGAVTTRRVAKEMLKQCRKPRDKNEQMIVNGYETMQTILKRKYDIELCTKLKSMWKKLSDTIYQGRNPNVLDLGAGIGQNFIMLARLGFDVTIADLDSKTLDFAEFRLKEHDIAYKIFLKHIT